jgi:hypothetical protein
MSKKMRAVGLSPRWRTEGFFVQKSLVADDRLILRGFERVPVLKPLAASFGRGLFLSPLAGQLGIDPDRHI